MPSIAPPALLYAQLFSSDMGKVTDAVIACAVVLALDMAAGILAILAQSARNKAKCDAVQGYQFGLAASVLFIAAHLSANIPASCCLCVCEPDYNCCRCRCRPQLKDIRASMSSKRMDLAITWTSLAVFVVGGVLLVGGTKWCGFVHGHAVGIGAILCFVHGGVISGFYMPAIIAAAGCCQAHQQAPQDQQHP